MPTDAVPRVGIVPIDEYEEKPIADNEVMASSAPDALHTAASITKAEFVTQANEICAEGSKTIDAAANETFTGGQPSQEDIVAFWGDTLIPSVTDQIAQIKALGIPAGDEDQVNALFAEVDSAISEAQQEVDSGDVTNQDPFADANKLAGEYGLKECAG
jgi:hypothetical protein